MKAALCEKAAVVRAQRTQSWRATKRELPSGCRVHALSGWYSAGVPKASRWPFIVDASSSRRPSPSRSSAKTIAYEASPMSTTSGAARFDMAGKRHAKWSGAARIQLLLRGGGERW